MSETSITENSIVFKSEDKTTYVSPNFSGGFSITSDPPRVLEVLDGEKDGKGGKVIFCDQDMRNYDSYRHTYPSSTICFEDTYKLKCIIRGLFDENGGRNHIDDKMFAEKMLEISKRQCNEINIQFGYNFRYHIKIKWFD